MTETEKTEMKENGMKKQIRWILICLAAGLAFLLGGCGRNTLSTPGRVQIDPITLTLSWKAVGGAAYYTVEITGNGTTVEKDSGKNSYSLERLEEGSYSLRVRAVAGSDGEKKDSGWSQTLNFVREHETGLVFALNSRGTAFEVTGLGSATGEVTVPDTYRGLPVTGIADRAFYNKSAVTGVALGENIVSIGEQAFANCSYLNSVNLPVNLKTIGKMAFQSCRVLTTPAVIPAGVREIGEQAFQYCRKLPSVSFGETLTAIGDNAFDGCESLESVTVPNSVVSLGDGAFARCTSLKRATLGTGFPTLGTDVFRQCTALTDMTVGENVRTIGSYAFAGCSALTTVAMGDSVKEIGESAFADCAALGQLPHLSTALERIGKSAFAGTPLFTGAGADVVYVGNWLLGCVSKTMQGKTVADGTVGIADFALAGCETFDDVLTLPNSVKYIGASAFANCKKLTGVILGSGVVRLGQDAFNGCAALTGVYLGEYDRISGGLGRSSLTEIGKYAFSNCTSLAAAEIPGSVKQIGMRAFRNTAIYNNAEREAYAGNWLVDCKNNGSYGTVSVKDGTVGIADAAFYECKGITAVVIPDSVRVIGVSAFSGCKALESVVLPAELTEIQDYTFYHCDELALPELPVTLIRIGKSAFYKCRLVSETDEGEENRLVIPAGVREIGPFAFYGCTYTYTDRATAEQKDGGMDILILGNGVVTVGERAFSGIVTLRQVTIGSGVRSLGDKAFYKCTGLRAVTFGESLQTIGSKAFYGCSALEAVSLPATVTEIGSYAFYRCIAIASLELGGTVRVGDSAFLGCVGIRQLILPDSLRVIGKQSFRGCVGLSSLVIPATVESVGAHAFYGCPNLTLFLEAEETPDGFDERWNSAYRPAVFGVTAENGTVLSLVWTSERVRNLNDSNRLSDPLRAGFRFAGWSTTENGAVEYSAETLSKAPEGSTLFARYDTES